MKKILSNNSIRNKTLREREDLNPLEKTAIHRYHYDSNVLFKKWFNTMLNDKEKELIGGILGNS